MVHKQMNDHNARSIGFYIWLAMYVSWMGLIFYSSSQSYSAQTLIPLLKNLFSQQFLESWLPNWQFSFGDTSINQSNPYAMVEFFIRKSSHIGAYMLLTLLGFVVWRYRLKRVVSIMLFSSLVSLCYAFSDEWHQTWVPERTGHMVDVAIDVIGIAIACILYLGIIMIRRKKGKY
jgi:VanZ family protein